MSGQLLRRHLRVGPAQLANGPSRLCDDGVGDGDLSMNERPEWESVHAVLDYYDGPVAGVADFNGAPYAFQRFSDEAADDWEPVYYLKPIDQVTLRLVL